MLNPQREGNDNVDHGTEQSPGDRHGARTQRLDPLGFTMLVTSSKKQAASCLLAQTITIASWSAGSHAAGSENISQRQQVNVDNYFLSRNGKLRLLSLYAQTLTTQVNANSEELRPCGVKPSLFRYQALCA